MLRIPQSSSITGTVALSVFYSLSRLGNIYLGVYVYVCIYIYVSVCVYIYIYIYFWYRYFKIRGSMKRFVFFLFIYFVLTYMLLLWTPTHGRARAGRPARTYIQQLCEDTGCCPEDLPRAMNDREEWRERVRDIRATSAIWWWWWYVYVSSLLLSSENICGTRPC